MAQQVCAIVMGGIVSHIPAIQKLQDKGYYVILVDYLDAPPAKEYADEHAQISTFDEDAIYQLAKERQVKVIVNCCLEHLNAIIARVSERLGLPCLYSSEVALAVSDKSIMKPVMLKGGIPTTDYVCVDAGCRADQIALNYPLFVKPADGSGSNGVNRVENDQELEAALACAAEFNKSGKIIVEEEAFGLECNVYCYVLNGVAQVLLTSAKFSEIHNKEHRNTKCISTYAPAQLTQGAAQAIEAAAQGIAREFKLNSTPMFMQLMVDGDKISIIEFACRMPGGYSYRSIANKLGFDYFDFTLAVLLGEDPNVDLNDTGEISLVHSFYAKPGVLREVTGYERLIESGAIVDINLARTPGSVISEESGNREKVGHFVVSAFSPQEAEEKVNTFFDTVHVVSDQGDDLLRSDLRLTIQQMGV